MSDEQLLKQECAALQHEMRRTRDALERNPTHDMEKREQQLVRKARYEDVLNVLYTSRLTFQKNDAHVQGWHRRRWRRRRRTRRRNPILPTCFWTQWDFCSAHSFSFSFSCSFSSLFASFLFFCFLLMFIWPERMHAPLQINCFGFLRFIWPRSKNRSSLNDPNRCLHRLRSNKH